MAKYSEIMKGMTESEKRAIESEASKAYVAVHTTCIVCGEQFVTHMDKPRFERWQNGEHIQDVFPELSVDERELLISGICGNCFNEMFSEDEEN